MSVQAIIIAAVIVGGVGLFYWIFPWYFRRKVQGRGR